MTNATITKSDVDKKQIALELKDLNVHYATPEGDVIAVNNVSFKIYRGEILGLVGESGCGKTTTAMAIMRLVQPPGRISKGSVLIREKIDILNLDDKAMRSARWKEIALIPQGAMNSLNPVMRIRDQIIDIITTHEGKLSRSERIDRVAELLHVVGLPNRVGALYPHELSGGMKQRVCIAMSIALQPTLVVADEPTSALDVIVQRVVAQTLLDIRNRFGMSILLIGHDISLIAQLVDRIAVMYAGNLVELSPLNEIIKKPLHPYTQLLIGSIPSIAERKPLKYSTGITHDLRNPPPGCVFQSRCDQVMNICLEVVPPLQEVNPDCYVACHLHSKE
jgi:peptide/nickel transport system ATP-binding protein